MVRDAQASPDFLMFYPGVQSELAIPITQGGRLRGVVNFESTSPSFFTQENEPVFESLARVIAEHFELSEASDEGPPLLVPETSLVGGDPSELRIKIAAFSESLLYALASEPTLLHELTPRLFEELVGKILEDLGYEVTLTPFQKDGGFDILAETRLQTGRVLTLVECKKWSPRIPVGIGIVRNIYGVLGLRNASQAMVVTTSHFTRDAHQLQDAYRYRLTLKDYQGLVKWLERYKKPL